MDLEGLGREGRLLFLSTDFLAGNLKDGKLLMKSKSLDRHVEGFVFLERLDPGVARIAAGVFEVAGVQARLVPAADEDKHRQSVYIGVFENNGGEFGLRQKSGDLQPLTSEAFGEAIAVVGFLEDFDRDFVFDRDFFEAQITIRFAVAGDGGGMNSAGDVIVADGDEAREKERTAVLTMEDDARDSEIVGGVGLRRVADMRDEMPVLAAGTTSLETAVEATSEEAVRVGTICEVMIIS